MGHLLWRHRILLKRYPPRGKRVLDFGCMDGVFTIALQRAGADAVGLDISPAAISQAMTFRGNAAQPVFTCELRGDATYDIVFCCEVIEHVEDDRALVGELVQYLVPGGLLVGTTPVGRYFLDPDHKRFYDEESLLAVLEPYGHVRIRRYYRTPLRNLLPVRQRGAAVFIFELKKTEIEEHLRPVKS